MDVRDASVWIVSAFVASGIVAGTSGCSQPAASTNCFGTYHGGVSVNAVALDFPEPSSTGVPTSTRVLVLSSSLASDAIEIANVTGGVVQSPVPLAPAALPVPLPSPIATPIPGNGSTYFAVALPSLSPASTYQVLASENVANVGCVGAVTQGALETAGEFTTQ